MSETVKRVNGPAPTNGERRDVAATGDRIGRYVVIECIGEGGMGVVYSAFDPQLERQVAIKLLRPGKEGFGPEQGTAALLKEAQAMARLSHPNVVPVYDVGALGDSVFIAMEFIRGTTLGAWVKQEPRTWREVLDVFVAAGRGLEAAHASGLVHRDFKPSNVLVGRDGRPRVTDFGVARIRHSLSPLGWSGPSAPGVAAGDGASLLVGTPGYMAPEQLTGAPASPVADQFAFCVSVYESLFGSQPYHGKTLPELAASMMRDEVIPPPKGTQVPARVSRALAKGLASDPTRRHASMGALLTQLSADPKSAVVQWAAPAMVAVLLLAASAGLAWRARTQAGLCDGQEAKLAGIWDAAVQERGASAFAATKKPYAGAVWSLVRQRLDGYSKGWVTMRTEACRATRVRGEETPAQLLLRFTCLDRRLDDLSALTRVLTVADADVVDHASGVLEALQPLSSCADVRALEDPRQALPESARADVEEARKQLARARALTSAGKYGPARQVLQPLAAKSRSLGYAPLEAEVEEEVGRVESKDWQFSKAADAFRRATRAAEAAGDDEAVARCLTALVDAVGLHLNQIEEGRTLAAVAEGVIQRMGGSDRMSGALYLGLGDLEWQSGRYKDSEQWLRKALAADLKALGPDSAETADVRSSLGWTLSEEGLIDESKEQFIQARDVREKLFGADNPVLVDAWNDLAGLYDARGEPEEEARCAGRAIDLAERSMGQDTPRLYGPLDNRVEALTWAGRAQEGMAMLPRIFALLDNGPDTQPDDRAQAFHVQAVALRHLGRMDEALASSERAVSLVKALFGPTHPLVAVYANEHACELVESGRFQEALTLTEATAAALRTGEAVSYVEYPRARTQNARALAGLGRGPQAREELEDTLAGLAKQKSDPRGEADARFRLAEVLWQTGADRFRAHALATQARDSAAARHDVANQQEMERWLSSHTLR